MKSEWTVLIITAFTDFMLTFLTGLGTAMATSHAVGLPDWGTIFVAGIGGAVVGLRTIQQALKANPVTTAALKGQEAPVVVPATATTPTIINEQAKP